MMFITRAKIKNHQEDFQVGKEAKEVTCGVKAIWKTNLASHKKEEMKS